MEYAVLIVEYTNAISGLWEIWLTSTFAFVVGFHAGRESLTTLLIWIGCLLYFSMTSVTILRYLNYSRILAELRVLSAQSGTDGLSTMSSTYSNSLFLLTLGTMCIGSLAALYYAIDQYLCQKEHSQESQINPTI